MNFSNDTPLTEVPRIARHLALLLLLAGPIPSHAALQTPKRPATAELNPSSSEPRQVGRTRGHRTYLAMVGPSALTFAELEPPLPPEPAMPEPPKPKPELAKDTPSNTTTAAADTHAVKPGTDTLTEPQPVNNGTKPISILPDDTRREIRAEDVLPYFQFPGSDNGANAIPVIINPVPAVAPPSTATYRQQ